MDSTVEDALERRRIQNRMAQRRFRRNQRLHKTLDLGEAQQAAHSSMYLDFHSKGFLSSDTCPSPGLYSNSFVDSAAQSLGTRNSSHGSGLLLDDINILEHSSVGSVQDHDSTLASLQSSRPSSTAMKQIPSSVSSSSSTYQTFTPADSVMGTAQVSYDLGSSTPIDCPSTPPATRSGGWQSPLHIAARKGHDRITRILLQHNIDCNEVDSDGLTPIEHAAIGGHEDVVRSLLLHGARVCPSALHWVILHRREALLRILLNHCSDFRTMIDSYDDVGRTPLHIAIDTDFEPGVLMLLQFGANPHRKACKF